MIKPFKYQEDGINEILDKFKTKQRVLYQLSTGGGKTFIFCFLTKKYIEHTNKKILILCHRTELINQTVASMTRIGVTCESVTSKTKELNHSSNCYVAMVETANNRLNKNPYFFKDIGLIIADECHLLVFDKVFSFLLKY
jgi:superfamily II DNA or RNA helicase